MDEEKYQYIEANQEELQIWAYIEIMGHSQIAGRVSTRKFGTEVMLQIDVPKAEKEFSHSELYSPKAIFSIKPTTEEWCRKFAKSRINYPIMPYIYDTSRQLHEHDEETDFEE